MQYNLMQILCTVNAERMESQVQKNSPTGVTILLRSSRYSRLGNKDYFILHIFFKHLFICNYLRIGVLGI